MKYIDQIRIEKSDKNEYVGKNFSIGTRHIFGGHVLAQAILAAYDSVPEDRYLHSLHSYFILPGDQSVNIVYRVNEIRDGGSFSTRRVLAEQKGKVIFIMAASFQKEEQGYTHQDQSPQVAPPEEVQSFDEMKKKMYGFLPPVAKRLLEVEFPFEFKPLDLSNPMLPGKYEPRRDIYFKYRYDDSLSRPETDALLAYVSDYNLLSTAILPHEKATYENTIMASLDHAMWVFRPVDIQEWNLYSVNSPIARSARGFTTGSIYNLNGECVSRISQEGLIRPVTT
ncbi:acyl-CoA thioesterase II [Membranicola marinus]|uniref:Acyl-CoA thioesterase 2 n=1 Tax=Membranihabitans marinus TaxID=1227546 RepID=A0A953HW18_9BACT|nr:acyl-CoA thioesterase II [Membranihabitans marinus]MBY5958863.1 acyl-CoA thioesterase II [Membranihabitans marinus]